MMTRVLPENLKVQHVGLLPSNLPTSPKMTLTKHNHPAILCPPQHEVGCGNPRRTGDKTPQSLAVFLCLSFLGVPNFWATKSIMMGLFGQSLRLVAPVRGITTPLSPVANTVVSIGVGYPTFRTGITA